MMVRVISDMWPEIENEQEKQKALDRWEDHKDSRNDNAATSLPRSQDGRKYKVSSNKKKPKLYVQLISCYRSEKDKFEGNFNEE